MKHFKAIAAMSLNRVIGTDNKIPWHLPEDFKWFKKMTMGNIVVVGRKTFESFGKPLPNRKIMVLTRHPRRLINNHPEIFSEFPEWRGGKETAEYLKSLYQFRFTKITNSKQSEILIFKSLNKVDPAEFPNDIFICGGSQVYELMLPRCSDLYLTVVKREIEGGDAFFPPFEDKFDLVEEIRDEPEFKILHYRHRNLKDSGVPTKTAKPKPVQGSLPI